MSLTSGYFSLNDRVNKVTGDNTGGGLTLTPELTLEMSDTELIQLKNNWLKEWSGYKGELEQKQNKNEEYWLGQQFNEKDGAVDNVLFEALETFLPIATRPKPEPLVEADEEAKVLADRVRKMLIYQADRLSLNLKLKQATRYWALYLLGAIKVGWSDVKDDVDVYTVRPQKLIFDKDATIDDGWYTGDYIGEEKTDTATNLIVKFAEEPEPTEEDQEPMDEKPPAEDLKKYITEKVKDKLGTKLTYYEWWHDEYVFWTLDDKVLGKAKNPHWNYESEEPVVDPVSQMPVADEMGQPATQTVAGRNHFETPRKPYVFLSVFNLGKHPHDETNLISQNIPLQDLINKRIRQIDKNADQANGSIRGSGDFFTKEQLTNAAEAYRKGHPIWVPTGDVNAAISRDAAPSLPNFIYESLLDYRNEVRNLFGVRGSTAQGTIGEETVGGKVITKGQDSDRTGGGISVYLEQMADNLFNWIVQLMYVYYTEEHTATVLGKEKAAEFIAIKSSDLPDRLTVSVKEGSMVPQDPLSKRNEAMELWAQRGIDPITFFDRLDFPNPREAAKQLYLWTVDPVQLFPDLLAQQQQQQAVQQQQQQEQLMQQQTMQAEQEDKKRSMENENKLDQIELKGTTDLIKNQEYA